MDKVGILPCNVLQANTTNNNILEAVFYVAKNPPIIIYQVPIYVLYN